MRQNQAQLFGMQMSQIGTQRQIVKPGHFLKGLKRTSLGWDIEAQKFNTELNIRFLCFGNWWWKRSQSMGGKMESKIEFSHKSFES